MAEATPDVNSDKIKGKGSISTAQETESLRFLTQAKIL